MARNEALGDAEDTVDAVVDLGILWSIIVRRRRLVLALQTTGMIISLVVGVLLPDVFVATAKILPPNQDQGLTSAILGQAGVGIASVAGGLIGKGTVADQYVGMLQSQDIKDVIIDNFRLMEVYNQKYRLDTYNILAKNVHISAGARDGIISIEVEDLDPTRAAAMAKAFVEELKKMTTRLGNRGAFENRAFFEERLVAAKTELARAEEQMRKFQTDNKTVDVPEQAKASLAGLAQLQAELASQEQQLAVLRITFSDASAEVKRAEAAVKSVRQQIQRLEGRGLGAIPSMTSVPDLAQAYVRVLRELKTREALVELLTKQYEAARLYETKETTNIQVIQEPRPPDKKSKPRRRFIVTIGTGVSLLLSIATALVFDRRRIQKREITSRPGFVNAPS